MAINTRQVTASAASAQLLTTVPNGVCNVVISSAVSTSVIVGPAISPSGLNAGNAFLIPPNGVISFQCYAASKGCDLYVIVSQGGTTGPVSALVSTTD